MNPYSNYRSNEPIAVDISAIEKLDITTDALNNKIRVGDEVLFFTEVHTNPFSGIQSATRVHAEILKIEDFLTPVCLVKIKIAYGAHRRGEVVKIFHNNLILLESADSAARTLDINDFEEETSVVFNPEEI